MRKIGPYRLTERLGRGGMGEVYRAYDRRLGHWVAVKLLRSEYADDETSRRRFRREARVVAGLCHPAVVGIHGVLETPRGDAIVMELVDGCTLGTRLRRGRLDLSEALDLARQVAGGLAAVHARGLVHRDLKSANVMVDTLGRVRIIDFGLARPAVSSGHEPPITREGERPGTVVSMSPEQVRGLEVDSRSDLFALGALVYEMLSGRSPFLGASVAETASNICRRRPVSVAELVAGLPEELSRLVDRLLTRNPARRPRAAAAEEVFGRLAVLGASPAAEAPAGGASRIDDVPTWTDRGSR